MRRRCRDVYLPAGSPWFDFWTDEFQEGGKTIAAPAALETMPLYVRAGSIVPMTQPMQFVDEKPDASYEIRIYRGADGAFTLYEDAGDGYDYERGDFAQVPFSWNEERAGLTIGARLGSFPGMIASREYRLVFISSRGRETKTVNYSGSKMRISV